MLSGVIDSRVRRGPQRRQRARPAGGRLRDPPDRRCQKDEGYQQHAERQVQGRGTELDEHARAEGADRHAGQGHDRIDQRASLAVAIDQGRADRRDGNAGRHALHDAGGDQPYRAGRYQKEGHGRDLHQQRAEDDGLAAEMVGDRPGKEECLEKRKGIDREYDGTGGRRDGKGLLVEAIERCGRRRRGEKRPQGDGVEIDRTLGRHTRLHRRFYAAASYRPAYRMRTIR